MKLTEVRKLANFVPFDITELDEQVWEHVIGLKCNWQLLSQLWEGSDLPFPTLQP